MTGDLLATQKTFCVAEDRHEGRAINARLPRMRHQSLRFDLLLGFLLDGLRRYINGYSAHARPIQRKYSDPSGRLRTNELTARATDSFDSCVIVGSLYFGGRTGHGVKLSRCFDSIGPSALSLQRGGIVKSTGSMLVAAMLCYPEMESTSRTGAELSQSGRSNSLIAVH